TDSTVGNISDDLGKVVEGLGTVSDQLGKVVGEFGNVILSDNTKVSLEKYLAGATSTTNNVPKNSSPDLQNRMEELEKVMTNYHRAVNLTHGDMKKVVS